MKATEAVLSAERTIVLREVELPQLAERDVLIEVVSCGVCSSEFPVYRGETMGVRGVSYRYADFPCSLGHEVAGRVLAVGADVTHLAQGDRVTGIPYRGSGFATHIVEDADLFLRAPESIPLEYCLGEPLMAVTNIVRQAQPEFGDTALIVGDGFLALLTVALLARYPLRGIVVVGHHPERLALAREFGASLTIDGKSEDAYWCARKFIDGPAHDPDCTPWRGGAELAFEYAGNMEALALCASLCKAKSRARLMMPSFYGNQEFSIGHYLMNRGPDLRVCHPAHSPDSMDDMRRAMWGLGAGHFPIETVVTHAFGLSAIARAVEMALAREDGYIKGIVVPNRALCERPESLHWTGE